MIGGTGLLVCDGGWGAGKTYGQVQVDHLLSSFREHEKVGC